MGKLSPSAGLVDLGLATHQQVAQETQRRKRVVDTGSALIEVPLIPGMTQAGLAQLQGRGDAMCMAALELWHEAAVWTPLQPSLKTSPTRPLDQHARQTGAVTSELGGYCSSLM